MSRRGSHSSAPTPLLTKSLSAKWSTWEAEPGGTLLGRARAGATLPSGSHRSSLDRLHAAQGRRSQRGAPAHDRQARGEPGPWLPAAGRRPRAPAPPSLSPLERLPLEPNLAPGRRRGAAGPPGARGPGRQCIGAAGGDAGPLGPGGATGLQGPRGLGTRPRQRRGVPRGPGRWSVERPFGWLQRSRRLSQAGEALPEATEAWSRLAMLHLRGRRLAARA